MKALIITAEGIEQQYVTQQLMAALGDQVCGIVVEQHKKKRSVLASLKHGMKRYNPLVFCERIITKSLRSLMRIDHKQLSILKSYLGSINKEDYITTDLPVCTPYSANSAESIAFIKELAPDYIFVYGTGIIKQQVISLAKSSILNLHTGISPYYRGCSCAFWPLYNREPHMVGATVHQCSLEVDGGDIYGRASVKITAQDDHHTAFAKSVKVGAGLYAAVAKKLLQGEAVKTIRQDMSIGKEYQFKHRTILHDIKLLAYIFRGGLQKTLRGIEHKPLPFNDFNISEE